MASTSISCNFGIKNKINMSRMRAALTVIVVPATTFEEERSGKASNSNSEPNSDTLW